MKKEIIEALDKNRDELIKACREFTEIQTVIMRLERERAELSARWEALK